MSKQRGFTKFSVFLKRGSLLNPRVRASFVAFSFRKNQERASKFGSILGRDRSLVNNCSAAAGRAPNSNWSGRALNSSYIYLPFHYESKSEKNPQIFECNRFRADGCQQRPEGPLTEDPSTRKIKVGQKWVKNRSWGLPDNRANIGQKYRILYVFDLSSGGPQNLFLTHFWRTPHFSIITSIF